MHHCPCLRPSQNRSHPIFPRPFPHRSRRRSTMSDDDEMQSARPPKDVYDVIALQEEEKLKEAARRREAEGRRPSSGGRTGWGDSSFNEVGGANPRYMWSGLICLICSLEALPPSPIRPARHPSSPPLPSADQQVVLPRASPGCAGSASHASGAAHGGAAGAPGRQRHPPVTGQGDR